MPSSPSFSNADREYMALAIQCAKRGLYTVTPNPAVGCVLVRDGKILVKVGISLPVRRTQK